MPRLPGRGRRKTVMKPIEDQAARQVCFSKRRQGLFKKAAELSAICGAQVGAIVFSPAGRPYTFGAPKIGPVINRYLSGSQEPLPPPRPPCEPNAELLLPSLWDLDIGTLGLEELKKYEAEMEEFNAEIEQRARDLANAARRAAPPTNRNYKYTAAAEATDVSAVDMMDKERVPSSSVTEAGAGSGWAAEENSAADVNVVDTMYEERILPPSVTEAGIIGSGGALEGNSVADVISVDTMDEERIPPPVTEVGPGSGWAAEGNWAADEDMSEWLSLCPPGQ